jgi:hypothetical protein
VANPKGGSGSGRRWVLKVELTTYEWDLAEIEDYFCVDDPQCDCPTGGPGGSGGGSGGGGGGPDCDDQHPPVWWLTQTGNQYVQMGSGPLAPPGALQLGQAMLAWAATGSPPTGLPALEIPAILALWAIYFATHADPCTQPTSGGGGGGGGGEGGPGPQPAFLMEFTTFEADSAPVVVGKRCLTLPHCDCPPVEAAA